MFTGDYASWAQAAANSKGYADPAILERIRNLAFQCKDQPGQFERDSVILTQPDISFPIVASLLSIAQKNHGRLHVVDFGGSLGSSYFQLREFLRHLPDCRWTVVEQPHFVAVGSREFATDRLAFCPTIGAALKQLRPDVLLLSGVLQYLPDPYAFIRQLPDHRFGHILLDRTAFCEGDRERLTVQHNPTLAEDCSTYPAWFFNEERFRAAFQEAYDLKYSFEGSDRVKLLDSRPYYRGFLFAAKSPLPDQ